MMLKIQIQFQLDRAYSNYSETAGSLCFFSKDEATNFNEDIANDNSIF